jgi:hypothetical protein
VLDCRPSSRTIHATARRIRIDRADGFNAPDSNLRLLLTAADTREKVRPDELDQALRLATTLTWRALAAADATLSSLAAHD